VGVVEHHDRPVSLGHGHQVGERGDVAVHGEHAVGDQELVAARSLGLGEKGVGGIRVLVGEHLDLRP
jgi:hypothetical protein